MLNLADIFQFIVDCLNEQSLSQQYLIPQGHKTIFHVPFNTRNELDSFDKELFKKLLPNISFVGEEFTVDFFQEPGIFQWFPVIHITGSDNKVW